MHNFEGGIAFPDHATYHTINTTRNVKTLDSMPLKVLLK